MEGRKKRPRYAGQWDSKTLLIRRKANNWGIVAILPGLLFPWSLVDEASARAHPGDRRASGKDLSVPPSHFHPPSPNSTVLPFFSTDRTMRANYEFPSSSSSSSTSSSFHFFLFFHPFLPISGSLDGAHLSTAIHCTLIIVFIMILSS